MPPGHYENTLRFTICPNQIIMPKRKVVAALLVADEDIEDEGNCEANTRQTPEMGGLRRILRRANHRVGS